MSRDREMEETEQKTRTFLEGKDPSKIMWQKKSIAAQCTVSKLIIFLGQSSRKRQLVLGNTNRERRRREIKSEAALIC